MEYNSKLTQGMRVEDSKGKEKTRKMIVRGGIDSLFAKESPAEGRGRGDKKPQSEIYEVLVKWGVYMPLVRITNPVIDCIVDLLYSLLFLTLVQTYSNDYILAWYLGMTSSNSTVERALNSAEETNAWHVMLLVYESVKLALVGFSVLKFYHTYRKSTAGKNNNDNGNYLVRCILFFNAIECRVCTPVFGIGGNRIRSVRGYSLPLLSILLHIISCCIDYHINFDYSFVHRDLFSSRSSQPARRLIFAKGSEILLTTSALFLGNTTFSGNLLELALNMLILLYLWQIGLDSMTRHITVGLGVLTFVECITLLAGGGQVLTWNMLRCYKVMSVLLAFTVVSRLAQTLARERERETLMSQVYMLSSEEKVMQYIVTLTAFVGVGSVASTSLLTVSLLQHIQTCRQPMCLCSILSISVPKTASYEKVMGAAQRLFKLKNQTHNGISFITDNLQTMKEICSRLKDQIAKEFEEKETKISLVSLPNLDSPRRCVNRKRKLSAIKEDGGGDITFQTVTNLPSLHSPRASTSGGLPMILTSIPSLTLLFLSSIIPSLSKISLVSLHFFHSLFLSSVLDLPLAALVHMLRHLHRATSLRDRIIGNNLVKIFRELAELKQTSSSHFSRAQQDKRDTHYKSGPILSPSKGSQLQLFTVFEHQTLLTNLLRDIKAVATSKIDLYQQLDKRTIDYNEFRKLGRQVYQEKKRIQRSLEMLVSQNFKSLALATALTNFELLVEEERTMTWSTRKMWKGVSDEMDKNHQHGEYRNGEPPRYSEYYNSTNSVVLVSVVDSKFRITLATPNTAALFEKPMQSIIGTSLSNYLPASFRAEHKQILRNYLNGHTLRPATATAGIRGLLTLKSSGGETICKGMTIVARLEVQLDDVYLAGLIIPVTRENQKITFYTSSIGFLYGATSFATAAYPLRRGLGEFCIFKFLPGLARVYHFKTQNKSQNAIPAASGKGAGARVERRKSVNLSTISNNAHRLIENRHLDEGDAAKDVYKRTIESFNLKEAIDSLLTPSSTLPKGLRVASNHASLSELKDPAKPTSDTESHANYIDISKANNNDPMLITASFFSSYASRLQREFNKISCCSIEYQEFEYFSGFSLKVISVNKERKLMLLAQRTCSMLLTSGRVRMMELMMQSPEDIAKLGKILYWELVKSLRVASHLEFLKNSLNKNRRGVLSTTPELALGMADQEPRRGTPPSFQLTQIEIENSSSTSSSSSADSLEQSNPKTQSTDRNPNFQTLNGSFKSGRRGQPPTKKRDEASLNAVFFSGHGVSEDQLDKDLSRVGAANLTLGGVGRGHRRNVGRRDAFRVDSYQSEQSVDLYQIKEKFRVDQGHRILIGPLDATFGTPDEVNTKLNPVKTKDKKTPRLKSRLPVKAAGCGKEDFETPAEPLGEKRSSLERETALTRVLSLDKNSLCRPNRSIVMNRLNSTNFDKDMAAELSEAKDQLSRSISAEWLRSVVSAVQRDLWSEQVAGNLDPNSNQEKLINMLRAIGECIHSQSANSKMGSKDKSAKKMTKARESQPRRKLGLMCRSLKRYPTRRRRARVRCCIEEIAS